MQIACPECATYYELDERLLPPGGASVQCTQCSHVFTASSGIPKGTQVFGGPTTPPPSEIPRRTQIFGGGTFGAAASERPAAERPRSTQVFGAVTGPVQANPRSTQMFGALSAPVQQALPPFEPFSPPGLLDLDRSGPGRTEPDPSIAQAESVQRRRKFGLLGLGALLAALMGVVSFRAVSTKEQSGPGQARESIDKSATLLRRDDAQSLERVVSQLDVLLTSHPEQSDAQMTQALALALQLDDARMEKARLGEEMKSLEDRIARLRSSQTPGDWQNRVNALTAERDQLQRRIIPLASRSNALEGRVTRAFPELRQVSRDEVPEGPQDLVRMRALGVLLGVQGSDDAIVWAERYRRLNGTDGWAEIIYAEYALNARVPPDTRKKAVEGLESVRARDASFIRTWVLSARLHLAGQAPDPAATALEAVTALNPEHSLARELLEQAQRELSVAAEEP